MSYDFSSTGDGSVTAANAHLKSLVDTRNGGIGADVDASGYVVQFAWTATGEARTYKHAAGVFDRVTRGEYGAVWELVLKLESIAVDTSVSEMVIFSGVVFPGAYNSSLSSDVTTLGVNWMPTSSVRLMFNILNASTDRGTVNAVDGKQHTSGTGYAWRLQYDF